MNPNATSTEIEEGNSALNAPYSICTAQSVQHDFQSEGGTEINKVVCCEGTNFQNYLWHKFRGGNRLAEVLKVAVQQAQKSRKSSAGLYSLLNSHWHGIRGIGLR